MARKKRNPDAEKLAESILNAYQPDYRTPLEVFLSYVSIDDLSNLI
ncbi:hypothetical protein [Enterococcus avium]